MSRSIKVTNKYHDILRDYVKKLGDEDLKWINIRLSQRVGSDVAEVLQFVEKHPDMDRWLSLASTASDFFDMVDQVDQCVQQEVKKRFAPHEKEKQRFGTTS